MTTVAALEIGQSPRPDLVAELAAVLPDDVRLLEFGALDGVGPTIIPAIRSGAGNPLSTRLADGRKVLVDEAWIAPYLEAAAHRAELAGADAIVLLCAGGFADLPTDVPLIRPSEAVARVLRDGGIERPLVVTPSSGQNRASEAKWRSLGFDPLLLGAPLPAGIDDVVAAAGDVKAVVLDFVGHPSELVDRLEHALRAGTATELHDLGRHAASATAELLAREHAGAARR